MVPFQYVVLFQSFFDEEANFLLLNTLHKSQTIFFSTANEQGLAIQGHLLRTFDSFYLLASDKSNNFLPVHSTWHIFVPFPTTQKQSPSNKFFK